MADLTISWDEANYRGDFTLDGAVLATGLDLQTAILVSLFTDRLADTDDTIPDGSNDPRGWWGDDSTLIGSRLWLLSRSKQTDDTLQRAYDYIAESLEWLIDDGVVAKFDISCQWVRTGFLGAWIVAYKQDGTTAATGKYVYTWNGTL